MKPVDKITTIYETKTIDKISTIYKTCWYNIYHVQNQKLNILSLQYHAAISFTPIEPVGIYLLKVSNENMKTWSRIYSKFKHHNKVVLMFLLLILNKYQDFSIVFIVDFEHVYKDQAADVTYFIYKTNLLDPLPAKPVGVISMHNIQN